ncbi:MAG: Ni/Fe hydrogenase subunit alpha [Candidatus Kariarchaeaceae archaeon]|jgi:F420-non-reducing hydrogenase large subunit
MTEQVSIDKSDQIQKTSENTIVIDPITRLEGHGKITLHLDDAGKVDKAFFQVPELRGFEKFLEGIHSEELPRITQRICGVCPTAHHMASVKALDDLYQVTPPPAATKIRDFVYNSFMCEDHTLHFFFLGGPDFVVGPEAPKAERNILGVIAKAGLDAGKKVIAMRREIRDLITEITGKVIHPVFGLPGGISKALNTDIQEKAIKISEQAIEFAQWTMGLFNQIVLGNEDYVNLITSQPYSMETYYMGLVDKNNQVNFYDGDIRIFDPTGKEYAKFDVHNYTDYIAERVEPWSYVRQTYLKPVGWNGFVDGIDSGLYRVNPLARLNVSDGMPTPLAQAEYDRMYETLGGKPVHMTLAWHWARCVETLYAAERMLELAKDPDFVDSNVRELPSKTPKEGIGVVEAPRGVLIHHYNTDDLGVIEKANLIVATQQNAAPINLGIKTAAQGVISDGYVTDGMLNKIEMAFRAYDPCFACATHTLPGQLPLNLEVYNNKDKMLSSQPMWKRREEK